MDAPFGWGIAGFGWVARDFAVPGILASGGVIRRVCDPSSEARDVAAGVCDGRVHADIAPLLADDSVQAIYVATPNHLHRAITEQALRAGKPVLCEKPMASDLADAEAMATAAARVRALYGTAFDQRHHPSHAALRKAIRDGLVGDVTAVRIVYACWLDASWQRGGGGDNWRIDPRRAGGGALMDLAPHGLDLIDCLLGEPVVEALAFTQRRVHDYAVDDGAVLIGRTGRGVLASLHVSYNCPETLPRRRLEIAGTGGLLVAQDTMGQDAGGRVTLTRADTGAAEALPVPQIGASPFTRQMAAFARAVETGDPGPFDAQRDLHVMRLIARAYREDARCH